MLTVVEDLVFLLLDDKSGKIKNIDLIVLNYSMSGAVLMELALLNKIDTDLDKLMVVDTDPTGNMLLDKYLGILSEENDQSDRNTKYWLSRISGYGEEILETSIDLLIQKNILKVEEKKILWVFGKRRYPSVDEKHEKEVKRRIIDLLLSDDIPDPKDVVLVNLLDTCSLFPTIFSNEEVERLNPRIQQIKRLDLIGQAVSQVLDRLRSDIGDAMLMIPQ